MCAKSPLLNFCPFRPITQKCPTTHFLLCLTQIASKWGVSTHLCFWEHSTIIIMRTSTHCVYTHITVCTYSTVYAFSAYVRARYFAWLDARLRYSAHTRTKLKGEVPNTCDRYTRHTAMYLLRSITYKYPTRPLQQACPKRDWVDPFLYHWNIRKSHHYMCNVKVLKEIQYQLYLTCFGLHFRSNNGILVTVISFSFSCSSCFDLDTVGGSSSSEGREKKEGDTHTITVQ